MACDVAYVGSTSVFLRMTLRNRLLTETVAAVLHITLIGSNHRKFDFKRAGDKG